VKKARTVKVSKLFVLVVVFLFLIIIGKLSYIVLSKKVDGIDLTAFAANRNTKKETIIAERGKIYDALGNKLAVNVNSYTVIAYLSASRTTNEKKPEHVVDKENTAKQLSPLINMTEERILMLLNTEGVYQVELGPGGRGITELQKETIEALNLPGIDFIKSVKRYYPNRDFLSYTLGYAKTNEDGSIIGEMGLELEFNDELTGENGSRTYESDIYGYKIANTEERIIKSESGKNIYLTIDTNIQMFAEQAIAKLETASSLEWATISVVNAKTGEILGVASSPSFDPNTKEIVNYYDPFVSYTYEPGSTMKIFSFMAAIENGIYNGDELYDSGTIQVEDALIKDWNDYGWGTITFDQGFYGSSNVAATILSQRLGGQALKDFYKKLGLGKKTKISLPNEQEGTLNFQYNVEVANASFGQGMSVTPVQMVQALTSLANDGTIIRPYIVSKIEDATTGKTLLENKRKEVGKAASKETIKKMQDMMWGVVNSNERTASGKSYKTNIVTTIGKTGTAQIASANGGYLKGSINYIRSFAGLFPYENPQIIVYLAVSKISNSNLTSEAVKTLIEDVSTYLGIVDNGVHTSDATYVAESYINKKTSDVQEKLNAINITPIIIGNGDKIIKQYPEKDVKMSANDKLFLLTNGTDLKHVNIENWSRIDLTQYAKILGINFTFNGYGYAKNTSLTNLQINKGETIEITLEPKYTNTST
jgi:penicillin-binding protein 2B